MQSLTEGRLTFKFPDGVEAAKLDDWGFYRNQFQKLGATLRVPCGHCGTESDANNVNRRRHWGSSQSTSWSWTRRKVAG